MRCRAVRLRRTRRRQLTRHSRRPTGLAGRLAARTLLHHRRIAFRPRSDPIAGGRGLSRYGNPTSESGVHNRRSTGARPSTAARRVRERSRRPSSRSRSLRHRRFPSDRSSPPRHRPLPGPGPSQGPGPSRAGPSQRPGPSPDPARRRDIGRTLAANAAARPKPDRPAAAVVAGGGTSGTLQPARRLGRRQWKRGTGRPVARRSAVVRRARQGGSASR